MAKGMLIVIEGIDGAGKSTLAFNLSQLLQSHGHTVVTTKEPGGSPLGKALRSILQQQPVPITPLAEFLLFAADRAQHIQEIIKPALAKGMIVISDRMADSSLAYQGYGRGIDVSSIKMVNTWVMQNISPDIIFYIQITPQNALHRIETRTALSVFDKEKISFIQQVVTGFEQIFLHRKEVIFLDGTLSSDELTHLAYQKIQTWQQIQ